MAEPFEKTLTQLRQDLDADRVTSADIVRSLLARMDAVEPRIHAFLHVDRARAIADAATSDRLIAEGRSRGPLEGLPVAIKANICRRGAPCSCGSRHLEKYTPTYDATVVQKLENAGAVILGTANMDEFAMGSSTENSAFGPTRNPWDLERIPGGSSGGSAAAVAAGSALAALGSDTGGSIRQPAGLCGVVGLKPTYGRVSRYGLVAFASSLDQIGPLARSAEDAALLLDVLAGHDERDSTSSRRSAGGFLDAARKCEAKGLRIGLPREFFSGDGVDAEVLRVVREAVRVYEKLGARTVDVELPNGPYAIAVYYLIATAEASSNLARYDGVHYGHRTAREGDIVELYSRSRAESLGPEVKRRIMLGTFVLSAGYYDAYYLKASKARTLIRRDFDRAFEKCDLILTPTSPTPAFRLGEKTGSPLAMYLSDLCTVSTNLAGIGGISLPCADPGALPVGHQLMAPPWEEARMLSAATAYERATGTANRLAPL